MSGRKSGPFRAPGDFPGVGGWTVGFFAFLYAPIGVLVAYSFNAGKFGMSWDGFGLNWYAKVLGNADIGRAAVNSLIVASVAAPLSTAVAVAAALALARGGEFRGRAASAGLILLPLMAPEIVTAVATLIFFTLLGVKLGLGNVVIAHSVFCVPFAYMPIRAALEAMDPSLERAARDLYASPSAAFVSVTLPLLAPGILSGLMLAFVISLDDFIITLMVAGAGSTTLPVYIYSMIRQGVTPEVNAISTILLLVSALLVTGYWLLSRRAGASSESPMNRA